MENKVETYSDMNISDNNEPKYSEEVEIHETLDVTEETITSEDLNNQSTHQLEEAQYSGELEDEKQDMEEKIPPEYQGDPYSIIKYM